MSKTKEKIRSFAKKNGVTIREPEDNLWLMVVESTVVVIKFSTLKTTKKQMVSFSSIVVVGCRVDSTLMNNLLKRNSEMEFGAFCLDGDNSILYTYSVFGGQHIDEDIFLRVLAMVAVVAKKYSKEIISTHGGKTSLDFVQD